MSRLPEQANSSETASQSTNQGQRTSEMPTRSVRLGRTEAAGWLEQIRVWTAQGEESADLQALRDALENACWMARWKREDVILELCPGVVAGLLETLVRMHLENSEEMAEALESMVRKLSGT